MDGDVINLLVLMIAQNLAAMLALAAEVGASPEYFDLLNELVTIYVDQVTDLLPAAATEYPELFELMQSFLDHVNDIAGR